MARMVVHQGWRAVVRRDGAVVTVLEPGRHRLAGPFWRRSVDRVNVRRQLLLVTGQEVATADAPGVKVSAVLTWRVADPVAWLDETDDPREVLRVAVQLVMRDWAASADLEQLVVARGAATPVLTAAVSDVAARVGAEVEALEVRDVVVPGELRRAALAVAAARHEGLAALERARGEAAALRALANGARVLEQHPQLARLQLAQAAAASGGQVVLKVPAV